MRNLEHKIFIAAIFRKFIIINFQKLLIQIIRNTMADADKIYLYSEETYGHVVMQQLIMINGEQLRTNIT